VKIHVEIKEKNVDAKRKTNAVSILYATNDVIVKNVNYNRKIYNLIKCHKGIKSSRITNR